jgi:LmbE family N-acetylglucosaminyl deacetylase
LDILAALDVHGLMVEGGKQVAKQKFNMVVVAHPDDETIFFGGLIQSERRRPWRVLVATDGNFAGRGAHRFFDLERACRRLGVREVIGLGFEDNFHRRLPTRKLTAAIEAYAEDVAEVFTHSIIGDYGHPHHQDVAWTTAQAIPDPKRWHVAYNCRAEKLIPLSLRQFDVKTEILSRIYFAETHRFQNYLPATAAEGFVRLNRTEVDHIYAVLTRKTKLRRNLLRVYRWYADYLAARDLRLKTPL